MSRLKALQKQIYDVLKDKRVEHVSVVRADKGCSLIRAKVECVIQLAAAQASIPCKLVAAQTVAAAEKRKINEIAEPDFQLAIKQISPGYLRKAANCAWSLMNAKQGSG